jgi:EgtB-related family protein
MIAAERKEFVWGSVWEWTNDIFKSYNKFRPHPYSDYSKPWFNDHQVVKGSSFATQKEFKNSTFRNFYQKHRNDVFIGFRTVKDLL